MEVKYVIPVIILLIVFLLWTNRKESMECTPYKTQSVTSGIPFSCHTRCKHNA